MWEAAQLAIIYCLTPTPVFFSVHFAVLLYVRIGIVEIMPFIILLVVRLTSTYRIEAINHLNR